MTILKRRKILLLAIISILFTISLSTEVRAKSAPQATLEQKYPGLTMGILQRAVLKQLPKGTLLKAGDILITESDLAKLVDNADPKIQNELKKT
ncbi:MAG: hypothetical protein DRH12_15075 [Deltaproteobacteria bacterium]|nr:MAG: hypothetical protein DRH12_15075 [Deltaproteobacteria bacterium]RLB80721.1 MAG: hypothetical protein DRH15_07325 [Deltaproteobacteria bacterium]